MHHDSDITSLMWCLGRSAKISQTLLPRMQDIRQSSYTLQEGQRLFSGVVEDVSFALTEQFYWIALKHGDPLIESLSVALPLAHGSLLLKQAHSFDSSFDRVDLCGPPLSQSMAWAGIAFAVDDYNISVHERFAAVCLFVQATETHSRFLRGDSPLWGQALAMADQLAKISDNSVISAQVRGRRAFTQKQMNLGR